MPRLLLALLLSATFAGTSNAVIVLNRTNERHERFENSSEFSNVSGGIDFAGVGRASGGWVTMISERHFLTAGHTTPTGTVTFHFDNSPSSTAPTATCNIASSFQISNGAGMPPTDLRFGTIDTSSCTFVNMPTTTLPFYEIADYDSGNPDQYDGQIAVQAGLSSTTYGPAGTTNFRVGRNRISETTEDETLNITPLGDRKGDWAYYADDSQDGDLGTPKVARATDVLDPDETYYQGGDSGGPSFLFSSGKLIGIHSFTEGMVTYTDLDERRASGDVFLPGYKAQLMALTSVPEPSQWLLLLTILGCLALRQALVTALPSLR